MPEMPGREVAERVHALQPAIRVVYMSGYSDRAPGAEAHPDGPMVEKPFRSADLLAKVRRPLDVAGPSGP